MHEQGPEPGTDADKAADSDEDIVVGNSNALAPNNTCPLTLKSVGLLDLRSPVSAPTGIIIVLICHVA